MKNVIIGILGLIIIAGGAYWFLNGSDRDAKNDDQNGLAVVPDGTKEEETVVELPIVDKEKTVIGRSVEGRDIVAYHFGEGDTEILFVGSIHGGYSWNTAHVAYETMNFLKENPDKVAENMKVTVVPVLNPDGLYSVVGTTTASFTKADVSTSESVKVSGRFNANDVDINRNFDCDWQTDGKWQSKTVSGGSKMFSEPESQAIKGYVEKNNLSAVIVWYSAAGGVFASSCHNGVLSETTELTNVYAKASGYKAFESFDFYETTGDMVNWLAKKEIPAISVLLSNHIDTEWAKNKAGVEAVLEYYAK